MKQDKPSRRELLANIKQLESLDKKKKDIIGVHQTLNMSAKETTADDDKYCKSCKANPKNNNSDITLTSTEFNVIKKKR